MAKSVSSNCTPELLEWARRTAGYTLDTAAAASGFDPLTIQEWEIGVELPSYPQLEKLAHLYGRPTMVFYLQSPPTDFSVVRDYRTVAVELAVPFSPAAIKAIRLAQSRQYWAREHLTDVGASPLSFVGSTTTSASPWTTGQFIRQLLGVTLQEQISCQSNYAAFSMWRAKIESVGAFVFQFGKVELQEARGFALADPIAPCVAINQRDNYAARTFTLLHEFTHVLLGLSGVSDLLVRDDENTVERFCERTAAEALMPDDDFRLQVPSRLHGGLNELIENLARRYRCSLTSVVYRLVDINRLDRDEAFRITRKYVARAREKREIRIPQSRLAVSRNGRTFARMAISAFGSGELHGGELASLLGMKLQHLGKLERLLTNEAAQ